MFTGIVQAVGRITALARSGPDLRMTIAVGGLPLDDVRVGDSIAVSGVCLTAVGIDAGTFTVDVSPETLARTTLGGLTTNAAVNLEKSLTLASPLGGHLVSGHVDGMATVTARHEEGRSTRFVLRLPGGLERYVASKGSICLDGVSLTVNRVEGPELEVQIIPHTLAVTTLGEWHAGQRVNVEVDLLARYVERLLRPGT